MESESRSDTLTTGPRPFLVLFLFPITILNVLLSDFAQRKCPGTSLNLTPNAVLWPTVPWPEKGDWISQRLVGNGDPQQKTGLAIWLFNVHKDMDPHTVFSSLDGEALIVPQFGALDITTELGKMLARHNEIAGHFRLPELGIIGTTGLANSYDFQIPKASFECRTFEWNIASRLNTKLWRCSQPTSPFNVVGWQGTLYPHKYDLARVDTVAIIRHGHADPSVFVVLAAPLFGKAPGTAAIDFACVGPRRQVAGGTYPLPWFHLNTMQEFVLGIIDDQRLDTPLKDPKADFSPFAAFLNGTMVMKASDTTKPVMVQNGGLTFGLFEFECPLYLTDWAMEAAKQNS
ncbi:RmlC-like cupin domain-containing protein [Trichoderma pleuroticola]